MRFKQVMLINPKYKGHYPAFISVGLGYIAESLNQAGIQYDYVDMGLEKSFNKLKERIQYFSPDLIGIQVMTYGYKHTFDQIRQIKEIFPHIKIVVGGYHISMMREQILEENKFVDYGIVLEGEETIIELCNDRLPLPNIKGLIYRQNGKVVYTGDRNFITNIDAISFPKFEKFELKRYKHVPPLIPLTSSRGCPYNCIYCPVKLAIGKKIRFRNAKSVVDEIEYWYQRGYKRFGFTDDNFTLHKDRVHEICDEIEQRKLEGLEFVCGNGIRADTVDRELLKRMKDVGFTWLAFGVEGGNNRVLKRLKKGKKIEDIERAISYACELGFDVHLFFLIGSPGETEADIYDSINLALKYPIAFVDFYNLIPFPKTELFDWVKENDYFLRPPEEYLNDASHWVNEPYFQTPELSLEDRRRMFKMCQNVSKKVKKAYLRRKLNKFGILGAFMASIYVTEFFQQRVCTNTFLLKIAKILYTKMACQKGYS